MADGSPPRLILAPIRGITDAVYRGACARCFGGFDGAIAPFLQLRQGQALRPGERRQVALENNRDLATVPQVLTHQAATLAAALGELHALGHEEVNWNLGCPHPQVAGRGRGAGLLPHPDRLATILDQVLATSPVRLSVKMRLGYRDPDEFLQVLEVLNRFPLSAVIMHPRTAAQMYGGAVDLARARRALAACRHPFYYNGDITSAAGFGLLRQQLPGAAGWMIGRGALACPFLPARLKGLPASSPMPSSFPFCSTARGDCRSPAKRATGVGYWHPRPPCPSATEPAARNVTALASSPEACRRQLRGFHDELLTGYRAWLSGPGHLLRKMQEHWEYLALAFADPEPLRRRVRRCPDLAAYAAAVDQAFAQPLADAAVSFPPPAAAV